jgi:hypothetical protein
MPWACSKVTVSNMSGQSKDSRPIEKDQTTSPENEAVIPPGNIAGTWLVCDVQRSGTSSKEATSFCALRDERTQTKVNLSEFASHEWRIASPDPSGFTSSMRELENDPSWHLAIHMKAASEAQLNLALMETRVALRVGTVGGDQAESSTLIQGTTAYPLWAELDGNTVPRQAIAGGTEHVGKVTLSICRVYANGGVFPGKLLPHFADGNKSACYTTQNNTGIESISSDARTVNFKSDVLMPGTSSFAERMEWITINPGQSLPGNAFAGGVDERGETLYVCRGSEAGPPDDPEDVPNDPLGEWTPGYVKASSGYCQHEYYGQKTSTSYQLLVLKTLP